MQKVVATKVILYKSWGELSLFVHLRKQRFLISRNVYETKIYFYNIIFAAFVKFYSSYFSYKKRKKFMNSKTSQLMQKNSKQVQILGFGGKKEPNAVLYLKEFGGNTVFS